MADRLSWPGAIGLAILVGIIPLGFYVLVAPFIFPESYRGYALFNSGHQVEVIQSAKVIQVERGESFAAVSADKWLDPADKRSFLLSFYVKFERLPKQGVRHSIVSKFNGAKKPFSGWSIALRRTKTSLRPEVYLKGKEGNGGWFIFDDYNFKPNNWYIFSLLIVPKNYLSIYVQHVGSAFDVNAEQSIWMQQIGFGGGYTIEDIQVALTDAPLLLGARRRADRAFRGEVANVLIAGPEDLPSERQDAMRFLDGGGPYILERLESEEVFLWIGEEGKDQSRFAREIKFSGRASWQKT